MWVADKWQEYQILDASDGEKLENWAGFVLIRPDPQVIWSTGKKHKLWSHPNAHYHRSSRGGGSWEIFDLPFSWRISYHPKSDDTSTSRFDPLLLTFNLKPSGFKHTGLFPEQAVNWDFIYAKIRERIFKNKEKGIERPLNILNLFAYTGGATIIAAKAGARVVHVDASAGIINWAKENALLNGLLDAPVRYLKDDARKFVAREKRRKHNYDAIIMDPPSYGRGPQGEVWKLEDDIFSFIRLCAPLLSNDPLFFLINSYTTGLSAGVLKVMLELNFDGGKCEASELGLPIYRSRLILPEGASARYFF